VHIHHHLKAEAHTRSAERAYPAVVLVETVLPLVPQRKPQQHLVGEVEIGWDLARSRIFDSYYRIPGPILIEAPCGIQQERNDQAHVQARPQTVGEAIVAREYVPGAELRYHDGLGPVHRPDTESALAQGLRAPQQGQPLACRRYQDRVHRPTQQIQRGVGACSDRAS